MVLIGGLSLAHLLSPALLVVIATVSSLTGPFSQTGLRSLFPLMVPEPLWERVNALDSNGYLVASILGPPIAAGMVTPVRRAGRHHGHRDPVRTRDARPAGRPRAAHRDEFVRQPAPRRGGRDALRVAQSHHPRPGGGDLHGEPGRGHRHDRPPAADPGASPRFGGAGGPCVRRLRRGRDGDGVPVRPDGYARPRVAHAGLHDRLHGARVRPAAASRTAASRSRRRSSGSR